MASIVNRLKNYLRTPQGQRNVEKAKRVARDPRHQQKARRFLSKFTSSRTHR